jgi:hypothetical protein
VSKSVLESQFVEHLGTLRPDAATLAQFPAIAAEVWGRRRGDSGVTNKELDVHLNEQKKLKAELLRAKLWAKSAKPTTYKPMRTSTRRLRVSPNKYPLCARSVERLMLSWASRS